MEIIKKNKWKIWNKKKNVEFRTFKRTQKKLPEMESSKQLIKILKPLYKFNYRIMDVGCASGHYYHSVKKLNKNIKYLGVDATKEYINFGRKYFKNNNNVILKNLSIYDLHKSKLKYDIVYSCNVILHLPELKKALQNLLSVAKKYVLIRTLISDYSSITKKLITDKIDKRGDPLDYVYQNTWSRKYIKSICQNYKIRFIKDKFSEKNINTEYKNWKSKQGKDITFSTKGTQISGSKVFEWEWILIKK